MYIIDVCIILFILFSAVAGFKRGVIKETANVVGNVAILILSFLWMGDLANLFYQYMPFLNLGFLGISLSALNILVYQAVAFAVIYLILNFLLRLILTLTGIIDKIVNSLLLFKGLSSILGGIVGLLSGYILAFIILLILSIPYTTNQYLHQSTVNNYILQDTPIFTDLTSNITNTTNDIYTIGQNISKDDNRMEKSNQYNLQILDAMLKYKIVSIDTIRELNIKNKLDDISNLDSVLGKYEEKEGE